VPALRIRQPHAAAFRMKKLHRDIQRAIESTGTTVIELRPHRGHLQFDIETPSGNRHTIVTAGSPRIVEHTINAVLRDLKRLM
jgi:hypothetical protein